MKKLSQLLLIVLCAGVLAPDAHAWPGSKKSSDKKSDSGDRYDRGEHGSGTDAGRQGGSWDKHTNPRPGRDSTKNRSQPGWTDRSGKRKP